LIILIILGEEYKSWRSLLCSFLHSPVTSLYLLTGIVSPSFVKWYCRFWKLC
jgi:hypothetical protein